MREKEIQSQKMPESSAKVSVIIPVFNAKKYLQKCLQSVLRQTLCETEIICVDDGSKDGSKKILQECGARDQRIKIFFQKNLGQGAARNAAIKIACGKYLLFLDADDFLEERALETLFEFAQKNCSQIVQFNYAKTGEDGREKKFFCFEKKAKEKWRIDLKKNPRYTWKKIKSGIFCFADPHAWSYFFAADFVRKNKIQFANARRAEDHLFVFSAILCAPRVDFLDQCLYNYRQQKNSITHTKSAENLLVFENVDALKKFLFQKKMFLELKKEFFCYEKQIMIWHYDQTPSKNLCEYEGLCKERLAKKEWQKMKKIFLKKRLERGLFFRAKRKFSKIFFLVFGRKK